jgi:GT2 family glycosyltransferase
VQPKVFAIVINWNGERDTIVCLESLRQLRYDNFHLLISDNGSRPESIRTIRNWMADNLCSRETNGGSILSYKILENGRNLGFTGANTVGIKYALDNGADYVLFLNNDTIVTPDFLSLMVSASERSKETGIVGCKIFYASPQPDGRHNIWSLGGYSFKWGMPINIAGGEYDRPQWRGLRYQPLINGCCMLIKRAVIETVGVQDDELFFGMDDVEYSLRASRYGWKNLVVYDAVIYHASAQSVVPRSGLQSYYIFRNALLLRTRHFPWYRNLIFFIVLSARYIVAASLYRWIVGRGRVNLGLYYALLDFFHGDTGECKHTSALRNI